jgi:hypothetical protein
MRAWQRFKINRSIRRFYGQRLQKLEAMIDESTTQAVRQELEEPHNKSVTWAIFHEQTREARNEVRWILQRPAVERARDLGIDIPQTRYRAREEGLRHEVLSEEGYAWLVTEVRRQRMAIAKDWVAIVTPILSAVIAILGLLVALKKH